MTRIRTFATAYEHTKDTELWWKLNDEMDALCQELRRYTGAPALSSSEFAAASVTC